MLHFCKSLSDHQWIVQAGAALPGVRGDSSESDEESSESRQVVKTSRVLGCLKESNC